MKVMIARKDLLLREPRAVMADSSAVVVRWAYEPVFGDGGGCL